MKQEQNTFRLPMVVILHYKYNLSLWTELSLEKPRWSHRKLTVLRPVLTYNIWKLAVSHLTWGAWGVKYCATVPPLLPPNTPVSLLEPHSDTHHTAVEEVEDTNQDRPFLLLKNLLPLREDSSDPAVSRTPRFQGTADFRPRIISGRSSALSLLDLTCWCCNQPTQ